MSNIFIHQAIAPLALDSDANIAAASVLQILYRKPNGDTGAWNASISGDNLIYQVSKTDADIIGNWRLQAYAEISGKPFYGKIVTQQFKLPIQ